MTVRIIQGDCLDVLRTLPDQSVNCCVTSPPYWGLRDYGVAGQIGMEPTPAEFVAKMVDVFREVKRVLRNDGTLWLNLGDSYHNGDKGGYAKDRVTATDSMQRSNLGANFIGAMNRQPQEGLKPKDLCGMPWRVAFALQADGWYLRQDIIWAKPNPMPESVRDRCTKSHEYLFLLAKSEKYYYDCDAIAEPFAQSSIDRLEQPTLEQQEGSHRVPGKTNGTMKAVGRHLPGNKTHKGQTAYENGDAKMRTKAGLVDYSTRQREGEEAPGRNKRSVWTVTTQPFKEAHFATFPPKLIEPCILAGCPPAGKRCDCDEIIATPTGTGPIDDPSMLTGRGGMNRPRRPDEGTRPITKREQRWHAGQMRESPHRDEIRRRAGEAFDHYIRTDDSGARPLPEPLRLDLLRLGWITDAPPCAHPIEPAGTVLDPFGGAGTTGLVANRFQRNAILIELNPEYASMAEKRIHADAGMFVEVTA